MPEIAETPAYSNRLLQKRGSGRELELDPLRVFTAECWRVWGFSEVIQRLSRQSRTVSCADWIWGNCR